MMEERLTVRSDEEYLDVVKEIRKLLAKYSFNSIELLGILRWVEEDILDLEREEE